MIRHGPSWNWFIDLRIPIYVSQPKPLHGISWAWQNTGWDQCGLWIAGWRVQWHISPQFHTLRRRVINRGSLFWCSCRLEDLTPIPFLLPYAIWHTIWVTNSPQILGFTALALRPWTLFMSCDCSLPPSYFRYPSPFHEYCYFFLRRKAFAVLSSIVMLCKGAMYGI